MPIHDWQFWVVSAIGLIALWRIARQLVGLVKPWFRKGKPAMKRASLTISARRGRGD